MGQTIIEIDNDYKVLDSWLLGVQKCMIVCGKSVEGLRIYDYLKEVESRLEIDFVWFQKFAPNPSYESVVEGVKLFREEKCDSIFAIGGGSAMDVAKCIKLFSNANGDGENGEYLKQDITPNDIPFAAMPTTAGTGSEATHFAVIYYEGVKQSVAHESSIPGTVIFDYSVLKRLSDYQKKSTMMDAFCHALESYWSVKSTEESREYSKGAINGILENIDGYLQGTDDGNKGMLKAANIAGKAINITQTTAGHAMCYKLTTKYDISHGHAAALCVRKLWPMMVNALDSKCSDPRGANHLNAIFSDISNAMGTKDSMSAAEKFNDIFDSLDLSVPLVSSEEIEQFAKEVNIDRLRNNPIQLNTEDIKALYHEILKVEKA